MKESEDTSVLLTEGDFAFVINDAEATVTRYLGTTPHVVIPPTLGGNVVTSLGSQAFSGNHNITSVRMPDTVISIGRRAFENCKSLERVWLSNALTTLDGTVFFNCLTLAQLNIPDALTTLERGVFRDTALTQAKLGRNTKTIAPTAYNTTQITQVVVPSDNPFYSTDGIALFSKDGARLCRIFVHKTSYTIPHGTTIIARKAFDTTPWLEEVILPNTVETLEPFAFAKSGLLQIHLPASVRCIGQSAFYGCEKLEEVQLENGLESIGDEAFSRTPLTRLKIPASVAHIGRTIITPKDGNLNEVPRMDIDPANPHFFLDAKNGLYRICEHPGNHDATNKTTRELILQELRCDQTSYDVLPDTVEIAPYAFRQRDTLERVTLPVGLRVIGKRAFKGCLQLRELALPATLESLGDEALQNTSIDTFDIPESLAFIGTNALIVQGEYLTAREIRLAHVSVAPHNTHFYLASGTLCEKRENGDLLLLYIGPDKTVHIPSAVTQIDTFAFCGAHNVREIYFHGNITSIGNCSFLGMHNLRMIHIDYRHSVDGFCEADLYFPGDISRYRGFSQSISIAEDGTIFNYAIYDSHTPFILESDTLTQIALGRLEHPIKLSSTARESYRMLIKRRLDRICRRFAELRDTSGFDRLIALGFIDESNIGSTIDATSNLEAGEVTGYLLEMKNRHFQTSMFDFEI